MRALRQQLGKKEKGFTLIELLIVIVILGILAAIVVFSTGGITDRGETSSLKASARAINTASEAYFAQCGRYSPTVQELVDPTPAICPANATAGGSDGFMQPPEGWTPALGNGPWIPFAGATMTYVPGANPLLPPTVTTTGGNGGGGGSTTIAPTSTTAAPGPCAFVSTSRTVVNLEAPFTEPSFTITTSGSCTNVRIRVDKNPSGGAGAGTYTLPGSGTTWTGTAGTGEAWGNSGASDYTTVDVLDGTTNIGSFVLTIVDSATVCAVTSGAPTTVSKTAGTNNLAAEPAFTFTTTGTCPALRIDIPVPNKTFNMTNNNGTWTETSNQATGGWTMTAPSTQIDVHVEDTNGNRIGEWFLTVLNTYTQCTYNNNQTTPNITAANGATSVSGGPYLFDFETVGPCSGAMTMALSGGQPAITGFVAGLTVNGVTPWSRTVYSTDVFPSPWSVANNVQASIQMNGTTISGGANAGQLDVTAPVCTSAASSLVLGSLVGGDWQVPRNGTTGNLNGTVTMQFTTTNTANCPATLTLSIDVPGTGTNKSLTISKPPSGDIWSISVPTGTTGNSAGWGPTDTSTNRATDIFLNGATAIWATTVQADFI